MAGIAEVLFLVGMSVTPDVDQTLYFPCRTYETESEMHYAPEVGLAFLLGEEKKMGFYFNLEYNKSENSQLIAYPGTVRRDSHLDVHLGFTLKLK